MHDPGRPVDHTEDDDHDDAGARHPDDVADADHHGIDHAARHDTDRAASLPAPRYISSSIADYVKQPGNQVIVVPNGTYRGSKGQELVPPARDTSGADDGWLVLVAQTKGKVVVDLASAELDFGPGDWRVLFVGFTFVNGTIYPHGQHLAFWYSDISFPTSVYNKQSYYRHARPFDAASTTTKDITLAGTDLHDASTLLRAGGSTNIRLDGTHLFGSTATDLGHNDGISCRGGCTGFTAHDSEIEGRVIFTDGETGEAAQNKVSGLDFENAWLSHSPSAGVYFGALSLSSSTAAERRGVFGSLKNVFVWEQHGASRMDQVLQSDNTTLKAYYNTSCNRETGRVSVAQDNVKFSSPPSGAASPVGTWRAAHPYDSYWSYFDFLN